MYHHHGPLVVGPQNWTASTWIAFSGPTAQQLRPPPRSTSLGTSSYEDRGEVRSGGVSLALAHGSPVSTLWRFASTRRFYLTQEVEVSSCERVLNVGERQADLGEHEIGDDRPKVIQQAQSDSTTDLSVMHKG